ncbi:MAG TPA: hypothetical protein PKA05_02655, partial [Roseiflexaceae bacterium]|nr:hypothetical protein [Roseiflexaceae bacterium]
GILGVQFDGTNTAGGLMLVMGEHTMTRGITRRGLQFHSAAAGARLAGAEPLAMLATVDGRPTTTPLVTLNRAGAGIAVMWAFDLPQTVALIRQGNPAWANQERDDIDGIRTQDMFVGWVDMTRLDIPQADEHQRLLTNVIGALCAPALPLPRLWYFPSNTDALLVATGDAHGIGADDIQLGLTQFERYGGAASVYYTTPAVSPQRRMVRRLQWQASEIPLVGAIFEETSGYPTPRRIEQWRAAGHGFGLHPYVEDGVAAGYNRSYTDFVKHGYGAPDPTVRTHRVLWSGWVETARIQATYGIHMNLDYYRAGRQLQGQVAGEVDSYLNGTGLPLPFVDEHGRVLNIFQQQTHLIDEHLMTVFANDYSLGYTADEAITIAARTIDHARAHYPTAIGLQYHFDMLTFDAEQRAKSLRWIDGTLAYAAAHNVPVMAAERWLRFTQARYDAQFSDMHWDAAQGRLRFTLTTGPSSDSLELLVPLEHNQRRLRQVIIDGIPVSIYERTLAGIRYARVPISQPHRLIEARYDSS